jgi:hypothetical protein
MFDSFLFIVLLQLKSDFMHLLRETQTIQSRWTWPQAREEIKNDPRFQAVNSEDQREHWFNEYIQDLVSVHFYTF